MLLGMMAAAGASSCGAESGSPEGSAAIRVRKTQNRTAGPTPVLVELFTSQGCESCPPADALLARLEADQPVAGALIIPIAWHVDYWNRLGWADPYSSKFNTTRQRDYSRAARADTIYTPQMIVDGELGGFNGQDRRKAIRAIKRSAESKKLGMSLELKISGGDGESSGGGDEGSEEDGESSGDDDVSSEEDGESSGGGDESSEENGKSRASGGHKSKLEITIRFEGAPPPSPGDDVLLWVVLTESALGNDIPSGENAGRRLEHTAVVRLATSIKLPATQMSDGDDPKNMPPCPARSVTLDLSDQWNPNNLSVVAFLQENSRTRRVLGVVRAAVSD